MSASRIGEMLLINRSVLGVSAVFGELLRGVKSKREYQELIRMWDALPKMNETDFFIEAGIKSWRHQMRSKGVGLIDVYIICSAEKTRSDIWTLDKKMRSVIPQHLLFVEKK